MKSVLPFGIAGAFAAKVIERPYELTALPVFADLLQDHGDPHIEEQREILNSRGNWVIRMGGHGAWSLFDEFKIWKGRTLRWAGSLKIIDKTYPAEVIVGPIPPSFRFKCPFAMVDKLCICGYSYSRRYEYQLQSWLCKSCVKLHGKASASS
jgi:uncharacterized protein (TIGR02996 family)